MKIVAIRQTSSGHNIHFISDEYSEYTLNDILNLYNKVPLENIQILTHQSGKKSIRIKADYTPSNNLEKTAITCNDGDYLLFDQHYLYLKAKNGRIKKKWVAFSGHINSNPMDQSKKDFGPLPAGEYQANFTQTIDANNAQNLWDTLKWIKKSPAWGFVATPLIPVKGNQYGRGHFYIHGGLFKGTAGCIEVNGTQNGNFHAFMRLYQRNFKLMVRYSQ